MPRKQSAASLRLDLEDRVKKLVTMQLPKATAATRQEAVRKIMAAADEIVAGSPKNETDKPPMCEECDEEMHPFAGHEGVDYVEGFACDECGWSFDTYRGKQ